MASILDTLGPPPADTSSKRIGDTLGPPPSDPGAHRASDTLGAPPGSGSPRTLLPPPFNAAFNFGTGPIRSVGADVIAAIPGIGAFPHDPESSARWQRVRDQIIEATTIPEKKFEHQLGQVAALPGTITTEAVKAIGKKLLGPTVSAAVAPYAEAVGDLLPFVAGREGQRRSQMPRPAEMVPPPEAQGAHGAGYRLAPEEISDRPSLISRTVAAISGKDKKFQLLSEENQRNTNRLAARALGLPENTRLNEAAFERVRNRAGTVYQELDTSLPQVVTAADPAFRAEVRGIGRHKAEVEAEFPETARNPDIEELREQLLAQPFHTPGAIREKVSLLRSQASANFRVRGQGETQAHQLGRAQREAADALENSIERSLGYGEARISAMNERYAAEQDVAHARAALNGQSTTQPPGGMPAAQARLDQARRVEAAASVRDPVREAAGTDLLNRYRQARQLFARSYDVEDATNRATGNVVAHRIAALRRGRYERALTGELAQIANAYDAFPRSMKDPSLNPLEDWSILDAGAALTGFAAGHYGIPAMILSRPFVRSTLGSERFQNRMFDRNRAFTSPTGNYLATTELTQPGSEERERRLKAAIQQLRQQQIPGP